MILEFECLKRMLCMLSMFVYLQNPPVNIMVLQTNYHLINRFPSYCAKGKYKKQLHKIVVICTCQPRHQSVQCTQCLPKLHLNLSKSRFNLCPEGQVEGIADL